MPPIDPAWAGKIQFHELLFGTWISYVFLVVLWTRFLRRPLAEWKYAMLVFLGAAAFWINHYFQHAPFWIWAINLYTGAYLAVWWWLGMRGAGRGLAWQLRAWLAAAAYTVIYILFEMVARFGVDTLGMHEFCVMVLTFLGFGWLIAWRGRATGTAEIARRSASM